MPTAVTVSWRWLMACRSGCWPTARSPVIPREGLPGRVEEALTDRTQGVDALRIVGVEVEVQDVQVRRQPLRPGRLGDDDRPRLAQQPAQRHLPGALAVLGADRRQHGIGEDAALGEDRKSVV